MKKAQGESTPKHSWRQEHILPYRFLDEEQIESQLHLPSRALGQIAPLGKSNLADTMDSPFSLVGSGELAKVVEKDNHKDILL